VHDQTAGHIDGGGTKGRVTAAIIVTQKSPRFAPSFGYPRVTDCHLHPEGEGPGKKGKGGAACRAFFVVCVGGSGASSGASNG